MRTCLGQLEAALLPSPDGQSPGLLATVFHRHPPLVRGAWVEVGKEVATALPGPASKEVRASGAIVGTGFPHGDDDGR